MADWRMSIVALKIIETTHYGATFTIGQLNDLCVKHGIAPHDPNGETGDLKAWLQDEASKALFREDLDTDLLSEIENDSGEVQGQELSLIHISEPTRPY